MKLNKLDVRVRMTEIRLQFCVLQKKNLHQIFENFSTNERRNGICRLNLV